MRSAPLNLAALTLAGLAAVLPAGALAAKDSLGVYADWGAFRDGDVPRCYAIAVAQVRGSNAASAATAAYASVGTWPNQQVRGQPSFRLSRTVGTRPNIRLVIGDSSFELDGSGTQAWPASPRDDAAIVAAMRAASSMAISASDQQGRRFTDRYSLDGAATAMDAASVGCARN